MHFNWFIVCRRCTICMTTVMCVMNRRAINIRNKYTGWGNSLSGHITLCAHATQTPRPLVQLCQSSKWHVVTIRFRWPRGLIIRQRLWTAAAVHTYMKVNEPSGDSHAANYDRPKKISRYRTHDEHGKF